MAELSIDHPLTIKNMEALDTLGNVVDLCQQTVEASEKETFSCRTEHPQKKPLKTSLRQFVSSGTSDKQEVARSQTVLSHQQLLSICQIQSRSMAGQIEKYIELLKGHIEALKRRKTALEKAGVYTYELTQQLEKLWETIALAQTLLKNSKRTFEEGANFSEDEMDKCKESLLVSQQALKCSLDRLKELLTEKRKDNVLTVVSDFRVSTAANVGSALATGIISGAMAGSLLNTGVIGIIVGSVIGASVGTVGSPFLFLQSEYNPEIARCKTELKATQQTLQMCTETLKECEKELQELIVPQCKSV